MGASLSKVNRNFLGLWGQGQGPGGRLWKSRRSEIEKENWYEGKWLNQEQITPRAGKPFLLFAFFFFFFNTWTPEETGKNNSAWFLAFCEISDRQLRGYFYSMK